MPMNLPMTMRAAVLHGRNDLRVQDCPVPTPGPLEVLMKVFNKSMDEAARIMWHTHENGTGLCGVYSFEVAETKVTQVMDFARKHQHPLQCIMEKK